MRLVHNNHNGVWQLAKWLGLLEATVSLGGLAGLVTGMYLLASRPLPGAVVMLATMTLLVSSVAKLGKAQEVRQEEVRQELCANHPRFSPSRVSRFAR